VQGSASDAYSGNIGTVVGTRIGRAETESETFGLMLSDGFFFQSEVTTQAECILTTITGCLPFMRNQASLTFDFTVDTDSTMYFDGSWIGGNEDPDDASFLAFSASFFANEGVTDFQATYDAMTMAPVPLPATGLMLIAGLGAVGAMRRLQQS